MPSIVAADPGLPLTMAHLDLVSGAVAFYELGHVADLIVDGKGKQAWVNSPHKCAGQLATIKPDRVIIERVAIWPGEDVKTGAAFVGAMHMCMGICAALRLSYTTSPPSVWKRDAHVPGKGEPGAKRKIVDLARSRHPEARHLLTAVGHHNRADALLLALWAAETKHD